MVQAQEPRVEVRYPLGPDSFRHDDVPEQGNRACMEGEQGLSRNHPQVLCLCTRSVRFGKPAALMVFQDGHAYINENGDFRVPVVFDNLIHKGEMPVTIGVFVDPGHRKEQLPDEPAGIHPGKPQCGI